MGWKWLLVVYLVCVLLAWVFLFAASVVWQNDDDE